MSKKLSILYLIIIFAFLLFAFTLKTNAQHAVITGVVKNGTTGELVKAESVVLMSFHTGMKNDANFTNADNFEFKDLTPSTTAPYLIQALYKGVKYNASVNITAADETVEAEVVVYDHTTDESVIKVESCQLWFQNQESGLNIVKVFRVNNTSEKPATYVNDEGTFKFNLSPESSGFSFVTVNTGTVPLNQEAIKTPEAGVYAVNYPLKPGRTEIVTAYIVDYSSRKFDFSEKLLYDIPTMQVVGNPANINLVGLDLKEESHDATRDIHVFSMPELKKDAIYSISLSGGTLVKPSAPPENVMYKTNRIAERKWIYLVGLLVILIAGAALSRNQKTEEHPGKNIPKKLIQQKNQMLKSIALLDDKFAQKQINESEYKRRRSEQLSRLVDIYKKTDKQA